MKKIFIITGEPSGDKLASKVISNLQKNYTNIRCIEHKKNYGYAEGYNRGLKKLDYD